MTKKWGMLGLAMAAGLAVLPAQQATAQSYPNRQVTLVVPLAPGGTLDILARVIGPKLAERWGQTVVVENKPGAGTMVGARHVANSAPDGYTLLFSGNSIYNARLFLKDADLDPKAFAQVGQIAWAPYIITVNKDVPVKTVQEFVAYAKANPGSINASSIAATVFELDYGRLEEAAGIDITTVAYPGAAPGFLAVLKNETQLVLGVAAQIAPQIASGDVRALAVTSPQRYSRFPEVPTMIESGINYEAGFDQGMHAPAGVPAEVLAKLRADLAAVVKDPAILAKLKELGLEPGFLTPDEWTASLERGHTEYGEIAKKFGIVAN